LQSNPRGALSKSLLFILQIPSKIVRAYRDLPLRDAFHWRDEAAAATRQSFDEEE
jgi:hypothetical protein